MTPEAFAALHSLIQPVAETGVHDGEDGISLGARHTGIMGLIGVD
jgi:hypothetical protein